MKNYKILLLAIFAMFGLNSCEDKDELVFTASPQGEFTFVNTFLEKFFLSHFHIYFLQQKLKEKNQHLYRTSLLSIHL